MAKRPSVAVEHQADVYREFPDDAIAQLYTKEQLTALPSMTIRDALAIVMKERGFSVKLSTQYKIVRTDSLCTRTNPIKFHICPSCGNRFPTTITNCGECGHTM